MAKNREYYSTPEHKEHKRIYDKAYSLAHKEERTARSILPKERHRIYSYAARKRGLLWDLSMEQFMEYWQKDCFYCGGTIPTIGLDRVDNTRGYSKENIVSCCSRCNIAKSTMSLDDYLSLCRSVSFLHPLF